MEGFREVKKTKFEMREASLKSIDTFFLKIARYQRNNDLVIL